MPRHPFRSICPLALTLVCVPVINNAQNFPSISYTEPQQVAEGVRWWSGVSSNPQWQIRIVEVDLSNPAVALVPAYKLPSLSLEKTSDIAERYDALAAINAGYFGPNVSLSHFEKFNSISAFTARAPRSAFGVSRSFPPVLSQTPVTGTGTSSVNDSNWLSVTEAIGGGPSLLTNGAVDVRDVEESFDAQSGIGPNIRNPRTGLAWNDESKKVWMVTVDGRQSGWSVGMTLTEFAQLFQDLGANRGLNYDGGGSTVSVVDGVIRNRPSDSVGERSVVTAWLVMPANTVDNLSPDFSTSSTWSASANPGFFGENSLIQNGGNGSITATWSTNLAVEGTYRIDAWWVAAPNRASAAEYTVTHQNGSSLVTANQTTNGSRWNSLGEFTFNEGTASVTLSNKSDAGTFVSADAVRWIKVDAPDTTSTSMWLTK